MHAYIHTYIHTCIHTYIHIKATPYTQASSLMATPKPEAPRLDLARGPAGTREAGAADAAVVFDEAALLPG
jgi:hypothetical protein